VFADEPTAALDAESGRSVVGMLRKLADQRKTTVFMVTHDHRVLDFADRVIKMEEGKIVSDSIAMESRSIV
jgi:putative ABC transport system ATP-binding protein